MCLDISLFPYYVEHFNTIPYSYFFRALLAILLIDGFAIVCYSGSIRLLTALQNLSRQFLRAPCVEFLAQKMIYAENCKRIHWHLTSFNRSRVHKYNASCNFGLFCYIHCCSIETVSAIVYFRYLLQRLGLM